LLSEISIKDGIVIGGVPRALIPFIASRITAADPPPKGSGGSFVVLERPLSQQALAGLGILYAANFEELTPNILSKLTGGAILAGPLSLLEARLIDRDSLETPLVALSAGQRITQHKLISTLTSDGWETGVDLLVKGDRVEIPGKELVVTFFGNTIESLEKSGNTVELLSLPRRKPLGTTPLTDYLARIFCLSEDKIGYSEKTTSIRFDYGSPAYNLGLRLPPRLAHNPSLFEHFLKTQHSQNRVVYLAATTSTAGTTSIDPLPGPGFISSLSCEVLLTEAELGGDERQRRALNRLSREEIDTGMLVTHIDHGIGRLGEIRIREIGGVSKEYVTVEYAEGDRLLVPLEQLHRLTKYIGSPDPQIHRLSGPQWQTALRNIQERSREMAMELLNLYAQRELVRGQAIQVEAKDEEAFIAEFPHTETPDQEKAIQEVYKDLASPKPMDRLICGDVGFGKTEVALRAAYRAIMSGFQVAILAPTTILAEQHYATAVQRMSEHGVKVEALSRFRSGTEQASILSRLKEGEIDLIVGTHRLLSEDVSFKKLGLLIIDEEQRFGVEQKERLKQLRTHVNVLTMSATPIPRTLHMALSSLRDISLIETPPAGRLPITTKLEAFSEKAITEAISIEVRRGGQVYYLNNNVKHIPEVTRRLQKALPEVRFGIGHGQLPEDRLAHIMGEFAAGEIDVLVCSTIIENGLDIPNANTIIVDHTTHFGLAQLYQLRGRVGRSDREAFCLLLYRQGELTVDAEKRLDALLDNTQIGAGYSIALRDLEIRGMGNILGREQSGQAERVGLSLYIKLLQEAQEELRSGRKIRLSEPIIDLPLATAIPHELTPNTRKRFALYREIDNIANEEEMEQVRRSLVDRYSELILELKNLLYLSHLRLLARQTGVQTVKMTRVAGGQRLEIALDEAVPDTVIEGLRQSNYWTRKDNRLLLSVSQEWQSQLLESLQRLTELA
jgi:transcription-repair coupling factor (superfamily II helicase)